MTNEAATPFSVIVRAFRANFWKPEAFMPGRPGLKIPGRWIPSQRRWVNMKGHNLSEGLASVELTLDDVADWPSSTLCILGRYYPAIDVDCEDEAACAVLRNVLQPTVERGRSSGSPRFLVPYLCADAVVPWRKILFTLPGVEGQQVVELVGDGRQWLACGPHPSGGRYVMKDGVLGDLGPLQAPDAAGLAVLTQADADRLRAELVEALRGLGATFLLGSDEMGRTGGRAGEDLDPDELEPTITVELLAELLRVVPDNDETVGGWEEGVARLASFRAGLGREGQVIPDCVLEWAAAYPGKFDGMAWAEERWNSFHTVRSGKGSLLQWAKKHAPEELYDRLQAFADQVEIRQACADFPVEEGDMGEPPAGMGLRKTEDGAPDTQLELCRKAFVYREPTGEWVRVRDGKIIKWQVFNYTSEAVAAEDEAHRAAMEAWRAAGSKGDRPKAKAAHVLLTKQGCTRVQDVTYLPGRPKLIRDRGTAAVNLYDPPARPFADRAVADAEVAVYRELVEWVLPEPRDQELFLDWASYIGQNPGSKVQFAPVLFSVTEGVGKDLMLTAVKHMVGPRNFAAINPERLADQFNEDWVRSQVIYVNELQSSRKQDLVDRLKPLVASHAGDISANQKGQARYSVPNSHCWIFTTNKTDALKIEVEDRRFAVLQAREQMLAEDLRQRVVAFYDERGGQEGLQLVAEWLRRRTISAAFSPHRCPAPSAAKRAMSEASLQAQAGLLHERLTEGDWSRRRTVFEGELAWLIDEHRVRRSDLQSALKAAGFTLPDKRDERGRIAVGLGKNVRKLKVWVRDVDGGADEEPEALAALSMRQRTAKAIVDVLASELHDYDGPAEAQLTEMLKSVGLGAVRT